MTQEVKNASAGTGWLNVLMRSREASLVLLILVLTALTTALNPRFLSPQSLKDLMLNVSIMALLVLGQTVIILMRQIDLSISSTVGITAFLSGIFFVNYPGIPSLVVVFAAILMGLLLGALNAALIAWGRIPALITTLGTLYIFRGANYAWVHGRQINAANVPGPFLAVGTATFLSWFCLPCLRSACGSTVRGANITQSGVIQMRPFSPGSMLAAGLPPVFLFPVRPQVWPVRSGSRDSGPSMRRLRKGSS
jgi:ABC-type xylose transport system permease subunit